MADLERLSRIIGDIDMYFKDLDELKVKSVALLNKEKYYSLSMIMFAILNRTIDLGEEVIRSYKLGTPSSYKEIFQILEKNEVITGEMEKKLESLVSMRNVLAHEYFNVTKDTVYDVYTKISMVNIFVKKVKKFILS